MRLNKHHMDALVLLAAEGACLRREYVVSGFPYRLNGTGCEVRSDTIKKLTRRRLVAHHVFFSEGAWRDEYRITEAGRRAWRDAAAAVLLRVYQQHAEGAALVSKASADRAIAPTMI
jgi:hypothetical protein